MPSSVKSIFAAAGLDPRGSVRWGAPIPAPSSEPTTGVYVVARTDDIAAAEVAPSACPLSENALEELLSERPELRVDGERPDARLLGERLLSFWLLEEPIVYIGLAGPRARPQQEGELSRRVGEYYTTRLGARAPHAGGWFIKTLSVLDELVVYYVYCDGVDEAEQAMLKAFADGVSESARDGLRDSDRVMPFANLEYPPGVRKRHGITGAKAARSRPQRRSKSESEAPSRPSSASVRKPEIYRPDATLTQNMTGGDVASGIIRVPKATKRHFPNGKGEVHVELRGQDIGDRLWDPRIGPDRERSGVLRVGKEVTGRLEKGERLTVERTGKGVRLN